MSACLCDALGLEPLAGQLIPAQSVELGPGATDEAEDVGSAGPPDEGGESCVSASRAAASRLGKKGSVSLKTRCLSSSSRKPSTASGTSSPSGWTKIGTL